MFRSNARLIFAGCAALAMGIVAGWTVPALLPVRASVIEPSAKLPSAPLPSRDAPAQTNTADEAPTPTPAVAPAARPRERGTETPTLTGTWIDHTGRGAVEITPCGSTFCGRIVWLKDASNASVCGTQVIGNVKPTAANTWDGGWIYDPEKKERYDLELKLVGADKLRVVGYLGSKFFSETFTWKRPNGDLKRCDAPTQAAKASPAPSDQKPAPTQTAENSAPATEQQSEPPPGNKKAGPANATMASIEKIARELVQVERRDVKGKGGQRQCTFKTPYMDITIPCLD